jgi:hypothetical protein
MYGSRNSVEVAAARLGVCTRKQLLAHAALRELMARRESEP